MKGVYFPAQRHYYYTGFRARFRNRPEERTAEYHLVHGKACDNASHDTARKQIQTETGVCGLSVLFNLHKLYGFEPIKDMVIDRMHLNFNMLKREFLTNIWKDMGENSLKEVNDRKPEDGGLID